jgi:hypothetical protein
MVAELKMQRQSPIRNWTFGMLACLCLVVAIPSLLAQSNTPPAPAPAPSQGDNPFPGEPQKTPPPAQSSGQPSGQSSGQGSDAKGGQSTPPGAKPDGGDNPFPGDNTNAPILPADPGPGAGSGAGSDAGSNSSRPDGDSGTPANSTAANSSTRRDADPDGDPVRTPDPAGLQEDDGFSSSRSGLNHIPAEDDNDARPGKSTKNKTREQVLAEDLDIGKFYMDKKNWKAAQMRFASAFALDAENADAVFELAEAERHLQLYKDAAEHYRLFLSYDPDGPHGRAAHKGLEEVESASPSADTSSKK